MPTSFLTPVPHVAKSMEMVKKTNSTFAELSDQILSIECKILKDINKHGWHVASHVIPWEGSLYQKTYAGLLGVSHESADIFIELIRNKATNNVKRFHQARQGEMEFIIFLPTSCRLRTGNLKESFAKRSWIYPALN